MHSDLLSVTRRLKRVWNLGYHGGRGESTNLSFSMGIGFVMFDLGRSIPLFSMACNGVSNYGLSYQGLPHHRNDHFGFSITNKKDVCTC